MCVLYDVHPPHHSWNCHPSELAMGLKIQCIRKCENLRCRLCVARVFDVIVTQTRQLGMQAASVILSAVVGVRMVPIGWFPWMLVF
jgi:hypothetical protein